MKKSKVIFLIGLITASTIMIAAAHDQDRDCWDCEEVDTNSDGTDDTRICCPPGIGYVSIGTVNVDICEITNL